MKKILALVLALAMALSMAACASGTPNETTAGTTVPAKTPLTGTIEELIGKVTAEQPVEFMGGTMPIDLADTSEDGLMALKSFTGLDSAEKITEAAVFEPMMGSIAFSLVMVRLADAADAQTVAQQMKTNIDPRKWICVEANDILAAGYSDVVMFIMLDSQNGMSAQSFVDAFRTVCGAELDFVI